MTALTTNYVASNESSCRQTGITRSMDEIDEGKVLIVLVGLPARGKSYISHKIVNYFR